MTDIVSIPAIGTVERRRQVYGDRYDDTIIHCDFEQVARKLQKDGPYRLNLVDDRQIVMNKMIAK